MMIKILSCWFPLDYKGNIAIFIQLYLLILWISVYYSVSIAKVNFLKWKRQTNFKHMQGK